MEKVAPPRGKCNRKSNKRPGQTSVLGLFWKIGRLCLVKTRVSGRNWKCTMLTMKLVNALDACILL